MALSSEFPRNFRLYVTHVEAENHFLRISGQLDQQSSLMIESLFETARDNLEKGIGSVSPGTIHEGVICAAKYKDGTYYRAKVINMTNIATGLVGVHFIDFGNKDIISLSTIRFLDNYDPMFMQLRGQASDFYLSRVINPSGRWEESIVMKLQSLLCYSEYPVTLDLQTKSLPLISIQFKGNDLATHLVSIRFGMAILINKQDALLQQVSESQHAPSWPANFASDTPAFSEHVPFLINQNFPANPASAMRLQQNVALPFNGSIPATPSLISQRLLANKASRTTANLRAPVRQPQHVQPAVAGLVPATPSPALLPAIADPKPTSPKKSTTYKSKLLEVNSQHKVFVSYADEGPELFAIQLASEGKRLQDMMDEINRRPHSSLAEPPMIGTVCLGRMSGDRVICRAIVMNLSGSQCKLFFVDFGDTEMVSYYDIFDIPEEYVKPNVFAMRFCLSGVKRLEKGPHINEAFRKLTRGKVLTLKVVSPEGPPLIQYGELYLDNQNILEYLYMMDKLQFKWLGMLPIGARHSVLVSYVDSCIKFYVQLSEKIDDLNAVMEAVKVHCENSSSPGELPVGSACCARFSDDGNWYRARVRNVKGSKVIVAYVDYGNEQEVNVSDLRTITPDLIRLPAVAMKCALKGFENRPVETKTSNQLEMLALEKTLMAHVVEILPGDTMLVVLVDDTVQPPLDVARRMNQLSQPRSSQEVKATTPIRKDAPESFSSPEGSVPEDGRKRSFRREKSFKDERRPKEGSEDIQRGGSIRASSPEGSVPDDRRHGFRREKSFKDTRRPPRDNEDFPQRGGSFRSRDKDNFDRSGPGRHSEKLGARPERADRNERSERRGGLKPWESNTPAPAAQAAPLPADDEWEEYSAQTNNTQPQQKQRNRDNRDNNRDNRDNNRDNRDNNRDNRDNIRDNRDNNRDTRDNNRDNRDNNRDNRDNNRDNRDNNRDNRDNNRDRRKPREQHDRAGPRPGWKKDSGVGKRLRQAAEASSIDTQNVPRASIQDRLRRDNNRFNQPEEREERRNDDYGNRTGGPGGRDGRPDRRDTRNENRGERRDNWGDRGQRRDFGNKDRSEFGNNRDFGNRSERAGHDRPRSNFTPRERAERSFDDNKSDKSFRSQASGDKMGRTPPSKSRSKITHVECKEISNPVALDTPFVEPTVELGAQHEVSVTWIISPESFYTQILSLQPKFLEMMHKIPELYKGVKPYIGNVPVGASVLARYPADGVLYRATVVSIQPFSKLIVRYVDFGNKQLVDVRDIWQMDKQLMELPKMAVHCSLIGVAPKDGEWKADTEIDLCFNAPRYQCVFQEVAEELYKVSLWNNGVSVADTLVEKQLAILSEHQSSVTLKDEPIDMTIIVGQQIMCRVTHVESHDKFCVQLDLEKATLVEQTIANFDVAKLTPPAPEIIVKDTHCTVKHDGKICRAVLLDTSDMAKIKALLPDYGTEITTSADNLMILPTELSVYYYQALQCCLNNYTVESEKLMTLEELKAKLTGNKFIIYVNDVDGITLVSTLYDPVTGQKIAIFSPDEGAYDEVVPLCMRAVFNYNFGMAYISHAENLNEFYLQKSTDGGRLAQLLDALYKFYEEGTPEALTNFEVDAICAAKSTDGNWYRATVVTVEDAQVKVHFTDYGNSETVAKDSLKKLDSKFFEPCSLALVASLGLVALQDDALAKLTEWTTEKEVQATLSFGTDGWLANLHLDGVDQSLRLINEKLATPQVASVEEPKQEAPADEPVSLPVGCTQVYISHIDTPGHFWLQAVDKVDKLEEIQADLQAHANSYPDVESREMGTLCIAKYLADDQWYRAEILDSDADITTVRFVDYGNTDVLDNRPGLIKVVPDSLKDVEPYAFKSSVNAVPTGTGEWSEAASAHFTQLVGDLSAPVDALIVLKDVTTYVDIYVNGQNLTDKLVSEGHAARSEAAECGDLPSCFASHVNSPSEFWVQLESAAAELQAMEAALVDAEEFPALTEREEGVVCAAKYPEDGAWYRAQVIVDGSEGTEVLFMDYGNASIANELRSLPDELKAKPALSRKCALQKPRDIKSWSRKSEIKFNELAAEGATIFNVQFIASGDISIVELHLEGESVTEQLVGLCEEQPAAERPAPLGQDLHSDAKLCYVHALDEFYVHLVDALPTVDRVTGDLTAAADFEPITELKVGSVCAAFWAEDEQWYRAKVLEFCDVGYHVLFIDYGNKAKCEEFRKLPEELAAMEPLAKCCRLAGAPEDGSLHESGRNKLDEFAIEDVTFRIEYLDSTKEPTLVKVIVDGKDLVSILAEDVIAESKKPNEEVAVETQVETQDESIKESVVETVREKTDTLIESAVEEQKKVVDTKEIESNNVVSEEQGNDASNAVIKQHDDIASNDAVVKERNCAIEKDQQFDDAEESLDTEKLNTSQPDFDESIDSTHTVIENKSFEAKADSLPEDLILDEGIKTDTPTTPEKDTSSGTLENSTDTIITPEREVSRDSINTDTGYTSCGENDKSSEKDIESPKNELTSGTTSPESLKIEQSPEKTSHESPKKELTPESNNAKVPETEQSPEMIAAQTNKAEIQLNTKVLESDKISETVSAKESGVEIPKSDTTTDVPAKEVAKTE